MHELLQRISLQSGITEEEAHKALKAVSDFVKEKYPLLSGTVDSLLGTVKAPQQ